MMTRFEITLGLLSLLGVIAVTALIGIGEYGDEGRMAMADQGFDKRSVEAGAQMFDQYCIDCHAFNASGLKGPPLDETSGLHGGDLGEGIAWRLEELNWDRSDSYGYVYSTIASGRTISTRPDRWAGNGLETEMAMPAWHQDYAGPLRGDQIKDLTNYIVNFRSYYPEASDPGAIVTACDLSLETIAVSVPTYESACYARSCVARITEAGRTAPTPPRAPDYEDDAEGFDAAKASYFEALWRQCKAVDGLLPPEPETEPAAMDGTSDDEAAGDEAAAEGEDETAADDADAETGVDAAGDDEADAAGEDEEAAADEDEGEAADDEGEAGSDENEG